MIVGVIHSGSAASAAIAERMRVAAPLCDMVELRLDTMRDFADAWDDAALDAPLPLILTYRSQAEPGGEGTLAGADRRALLQRHAQHPNVRWVDVELADLDSIRAPEQTGLVASVHVPEAAPVPDREALLALAADAKARGAHAFKFVVPARSPEQVLLVWDVMAAAPLPTIGIASGPMGELSRILYRRLGAEWTYGPLPGEPAPAGAAGQVPVNVLRRRYRASEIGPDWEIYGVLGNPVAQSRGVRRHNAAFRALGLKKVYVPLLAPADDLSGFWRLAMRLPLSGFSVTAPFKQAVMAGVAEIDAEAREIGAINTVVPEQARARWRGFNADLAGFLSPLRDELLDGKRVLILGAGGTARTAVVGLRSLGVAEIVIANRTVARAEAIARDLGGAGTRVTACALAAIGTGPFDLVANTTSVGMAGNEDESPLAHDAVALSPNALVYDVIYNPAPTRLLRGFQARGVRTLDGRAMYEAQSNLQFKSFAGRAFPAIDPSDEV